MRSVTVFHRLAGLVGVLLLAGVAVPPGVAARAEAAGATRSAAGAGRHAAAGSLADTLAAAVTGAEVHRHLTAFQGIADFSGGDRGYNRVGFTRSAWYVTTLLRAAGYQVVEQTVPYTDFDISVERLRVGGAGGRDVRVLATRFGPTTPAEGIEAPVATPPVGRTGCEPADYDGVAAAGAVVVLARAACGYARQQQVAAGAGARGVLLYYATPSPENIYRFHAFDPAAFTIPTASVSQRDGEELVRAARGDGTRVHLTLRAQSVARTTVNLIAETAGGDPENVVLLGAHLDSVPETPGINDNAVMSAAVLQVAIALGGRQHAVTNKVRFVWWGAEEMINVGSGHYVANLSAGERQRIAAVLNGELIASPNPGRFVWDPGTGGGHVLANLFGEYFDGRGLPYERTAPGSVGSDHLAFEAVGIPTGGLDGGNLAVKTPQQQARFGGQAGQMFDHCYHQTCDRIETINRAALDANVPAVAWVLGRLAVDVSAVRAATAP
ncbi:M28 family peptidase [Micromonospora okii]|uniref:M28 family peptidase n=1 Tax=Micromonospora okii TaxID=1182970 RepID=UPI001E40A724|nr:M28 family peptidase [Micromonospora okii]